MTKTNKLIAGKKYFPKPSSVLVGDGFVKGPTWKIYKENDKHIFEFLAARHGGGTDRYEVSQYEFEAVRKGDMKIEVLLRRYDAE